MISTRLILAAAITCGLLGVTKAKGTLSYGDECSVREGISSAIFGSDSEDKLCNSDKGLICTGHCTCVPTRTWDAGLFTAGNCVVIVNGPCQASDACVPNAHCGDTIPICLCNDGYQARSGRCVSQESTTTPATSSNDDDSEEGRMQRLRQFFTRSWNGFLSIFS